MEDHIWRHSAAKFFLIQLRAEVESLIALSACILSVSSQLSLIIDFGNRPRVRSRWYHWALKYCITHSTQYQKQ
jgi:hypothetical protein